MDTHDGSLDAVHVRDIQYVVSRTWALVRKMTSTELPKLGLLVPLGYVRLL